MIYNKFQTNFNSETFVVYFITYKIVYNKLVEISLKFS